MTSIFANFLQLTQIVPVSYVNQNKSQRFFLFNKKKITITYGSKFKITTSFYSRKENIATHVREYMSGHSPRQEKRKLSC